VEPPLDPLREQVLYSVRLEGVRQWPGKGIGFLRTRMQRQERLASPVPQPRSAKRDPVPNNVNVNQVHVRLYVS